MLQPSDLAGDTNTPWIQWSSQHEQDAKHHYYRGECISRCNPRTRCITHLLHRMQQVTQHHQHQHQIDKGRPDARRGQTVLVNTQTQSIGGHQRHRQQCERTQQRKPTEPAGALTGLHSTLIRHIEQQQTERGKPQQQVGGMPCRQQGIKPLYQPTEHKA